MSVPMETDSEAPRAWLMGRRKWPAINLRLVGLFCERHSPSLQGISPCLKLRLKMTVFQSITNKYFLHRNCCSHTYGFLRSPSGGSPGRSWNGREVGGQVGGRGSLSVHHKYGIYTHLYFQFLLASTRKTAAKNSACSHKTIPSKRCCKQGQPWLFIMRRFDSLVKLSSSQEKQFRICDQINK